MEKKTQQANQATPRENIHLGAAITERLIPIVHNKCNARPQPCIHTTYLGLLQQRRKDQLSVCPRLNPTQRLPPPVVLQQYDRSWPGCCCWCLLLCGVPLPLGRISFVHLCFPFFNGALSKALTHSSEHHGNLRSGSPPTCLLYR